MGFDKLFAKLAGKPVLWHSLKAFSDCAEVDEILIVTKEDGMDEVEALVAATSSMPSSFVTMRISSTSLQSVKALSECQSTGWPASGAKSLSNPMRRLLPAATMMALTMREFRI